MFIDAENIFYAQRSLGWRLSYEKLMKYFKEECGSDVRCFLYTGVDEANTKQQKFLDMLNINGFITRTKLVKKIRTQQRSYKWKGNLSAGKRVIVMSTRGRVAKELLERAKFVDLRKLRPALAQ